LNFGRQDKVAKDFDIISKYLLKIPDIGTFNNVYHQLFKELADLALRDEQIKLMIQDSKKELVDLFERERLEMENIRSNRSKDTFKSLRTALKATGKEQQDDD